jgi:lysophospholipase L1-like esterase
MASRRDARTSNLSLWIRLGLAAAAGLSALAAGLLLWSVAVLSGLDPVYRRNFADAATRFDPELGWAPVPGYHGQTLHAAQMTTNSDGFRSPELDPRKEKVVILGDSVAWGYGLGDADTLSSRLQEKLDGRQLQVVNMAVSGYGTDQEYFQLKKNLPKLGKVRDIVLVVCVFNDLDDISAPFAEGRSKPYYRLHDDDLVYSAPASKYGLTNLISALQFLRVWKPIAPLTYRLLTALNETRNVEESESFTEELFAEMKKTADASGARLIFVLSPFSRKVSGYPGSYDWYRDTLKRGGYTFLDFRSTLDKQSSPDDQIFRDGVHYTAAGTELLARELDRRFIERRSTAISSARLPAH